MRYVRRGSRVMDSKPAFHVLYMDELIPSVRDYNPRKVHRKTKSGCLTCKAKRVKCDELRPVCARCQRNSRSCIYEQPSLNRMKPSIATPVTRRDSRSSISSLSSVTVIPFTSPGAKNGTSNLNLMRHFHLHWNDIFQIPFSNEIALLSRSEPLVHSTILAITACHLRHLSPGNLQHRIAEHYQQSLALQSYKRVLGMPRGSLGQGGVNNLLLSAALLNILGFALSEPEDTSSASDHFNPSASWVFSPRENRLGWLALQAGVRPLILSLAAYLDRSLDFLGKMFFGLGRETCPWKNMHHDLNRVPDLWTQVFELDGADRGCDGEPPMSNSSAHAQNHRTSKYRHVDSSKVFQPPIIVLAQLRDIEPVGANIYLNLQILGKIQPEFRALLYDRDERALWLFGYWLGLLCRFEGIWWATRRARRDYRAICIWLDQLRLPERPGLEGKRWAEMMMELKMTPNLPRLSDNN